MPVISGSGDTNGGEDTLAYQKFSILMNASRRLAAVCASNVTREQALRKPGATKDYTRKGLTNLGPNDQEKWFVDPRLDEKFQLPDVFFTKDQGALDKGTSCAARMPHGAAPTMNRAGPTATRST
jgi:endonuclease G, mitochondrial